MGGSNTKGRASRRAIGLAIGFLAATSTLLVAPAGAEGGKTYTISVDADRTTLAVDPSLPTGATRQLSLTLTNTGSPQALGSANIDIPADLVVTGSPAISIGTVTLVPGPTPFLELRDLSLPPGGSAVVQLDAYARCIAGPAVRTWASAVKQANDFNGTGNDYAYDPAAPLPQTTLTGTCSLRFDTQPANTERLATITSRAYDPAGPSVAVSIYDGDGAGRVTWWADPIVLGYLQADPDAAGAVLGGITSVTPTAGMATFAPTLSISASDYRLTARTPATPVAGTVVTDATSEEFDIVDDASACTKGGPCFATSSRGGTRARVDVDTGTVVQPVTVAEVQLSIDPATAPAFSCTLPSVGGTVEFLITEIVPDSTGLKTVRITLPATLATKAASKYRVCFASPTAFMTRDKVTATLVGSVYVGLLPDCSAKTPVAPCALPTTVDRTTRDVTVSFLAPAGDPWGKVAG